MFIQLRLMHMNIEVPEVVNKHFIKLLWEWWILSSCQYIYLREKYVGLLSCGVNDVGFFSGGVNYLLTLLCCLMVNPEKQKLRENILRVK